MPSEANLLLGKYKNIFNLYDSYAKSIAELLDKIITPKLAGVQITYRAKDPESLYKKLSHPDHRDIHSLEQVKDLAGVRIICRTIDDIRTIIEIIKPEFNIIEIKLNPSNLNISEFGYQSQHLVIKLKKDRYKLREYSPFKGLILEIQVRTILQHAWADIEHGPGYKGSATLPDEYKRRFCAIAATIEILDRELAALVRSEVKLNEHYQQVISQSIWDGIEINTLSLCQYLIKRYQDRPMWIGYENQDNKPIDPKYIDDDMIDLLKAAGISTIDQLDTILNNKLVSIYDAEWKKTYGEEKNVGSIIIDISLFLGGKTKSNYHYSDTNQIKFFEKYFTLWKKAKIVVPPVKRIKGV
jgi:ppGpp synthetase/RelA/SpoT-type nucleotidyltranferase